ncbi:hypothetical protein L198_07462 [Cryptococcus wingfieldii CBS 7118]|uniref:Uncharacterized protein n=1 Tax=Cryptococcus wingfieldii CBS 7118 TaxID=1295528 RepID=A0A1E3IBB5_9TREE|nr:hypothetical protein L198_07462 [Cryptococcus wingfieldii CBS 7118]ODN85894.1 hypothetical protein L198_07462 [Cryptococcus wingfieldii CBS 7118]
MSDDENDQASTTPSYETNTKPFSNSFYEEHTSGYSSNDLTGAINEMAGSVVETVITQFPELDTERKSALVNDMIARNLRRAGMSVNCVEMSINGSAFAPTVWSVEVQEDGAEDEAVEGGLGVENLNIS